LPKAIPCKKKKKKSGNSYTAHSYFKAKYLVKSLFFLIQNKLGLNSAFGKNIMVLMTGTLISQIIPLLISPILTRIYSPEDFGIFSFFISIVSILSVIITGKYELSVIIPKEDKVAKNLVALCLIITHLVSISGMLIVLLFKEWLSSIMQISNATQVLYFIPLALYLTGIQQTFNYWVNRNGEYSKLANSRIYKSVATSLLSVLFGYFALGALGLILGYIIGVAAGIYFLVKDLRVQFKNNDAITPDGIKFAGNKYIDFPKYMIPAHGLSAGSSNVPVILITNIFGILFSGYFSLINRVFGAPMSVITSSFGDVFREVASKQFLEKGNCNELFVSTAKKLFYIGIIPFTVFFFIAPVMFKIIFGANWEIAGDYAQIMTIMFFFQFIANPLASVTLMANKQKFDLAWQVILSVLIGLSFLIGYFYSDFKLTIILYTITYSIMYIFSFALTYRFSCGRK
jgi:O-antigen/teichoic acid export membrane protein